MTERARLERRYRRMLACYPRAFRRESEDEVLAVLMSTAHEGRRRPGVAESADLIRGALRMHLSMPRPPRPVRNAVRLMCLGAVLTLAVPVTILVTLGGVRSAFVQDPAAGQWYTFLLTQVVPVLASAPVGAGVWLWLAWANGRGYGWARAAFLAFFGLLTVGLLIGPSEGAANADALPSTSPDLIATMVLWLVALVAMLLTFTEMAHPYYQRHQQKPAQQ